MKKLMAALMAVVTTLSLSVPAFAAESPQTLVESSGEGTSISITDITPREDEEHEQKESRKNSYTVGDYYPVEIQTAEDNGVRLLVKTFLVPQGTEAEALIEEDLVRRGVEYQVSDILCRELEVSSESKTVSQVVTLPTDSNKETELLDLFTASIAYNEDGFEGILSLDRNSLKAKATETTGYAYTLKDTREFSGLDRNDPYYIPKTAQKNGVTLQLADIQWTPMASAAYNTQVPSLFAATATYSGTAWGSKASEFLATASYSGEVRKVEAGDLLYSIVYEEVLAETAAFPWGKLALIVLVVVLCGAAVFAVIWAVKCLLSKRQEGGRYKANNDPYADRPPMDRPGMLDEMDRGLEEE